MAPFHTHFLIAEQLWPEYAGPREAFLGEFYFGNVAPDVDKVSASLSQRDTHCFDRYDDYELMASARSSYFLNHLSEFLIAPFADLSPPDQAFVMGYLCHLAVDEVTKHMWRKSTFEQFFQAGVRTLSIFSAMDEVLLNKLKNYPCLIQSLHQSSLPTVIPRIPPDDLAWLHQGVCQFAETRHTESAFEIMLQIMTRGKSPHIQTWLDRYYEEIDLARTNIDLLGLDEFLERSLIHCRRRLDDLFSGRRVAPIYP